MLSVKFLDDHDAVGVEYKKGDIIRLDNYVAEQLQSHNIVEILPDSPKKTVDKKATNINASVKKTVDKKAVDKNKKNK